MVARFYPSRLLTCLLPRPKLFCPRVSTPSASDPTRRDPRFYPGLSQLDLGRDPGETILTKRSRRSGSNHWVTTGHETTRFQLAKVRKRIPRPGSKDGSRTPSCSGSSVARLLLAAGPRKIPGKHLGTLASASASFTCLDARCRQSVRPLQILLSRRLRRQVHQQPSPPHRFCPSRPNTLARGCPMGPARALLRRACCRRRTSAAATSQPPRPHRLHWACW